MTARRLLLLASSLLLVSIAKIDVSFGHVCPPPSSPPPTNCPCDLQSNLIIDQKPIDVPWLPQLPQSLSTDVIQQELGHGDSQRSHIIENRPDFDDVKLPELNGIEPRLDLQYGNLQKPESTWKQFDYGLGMLHKPSNIQTPSDFFKPLRLDTTTKDAAEIVYEAAIDAIPQPISKLNYYSPTMLPGLINTLPTAKCVPEQIISPNDLSFAKLPKRTVTLDLGNRWHDFQSPHRGCEHIIITEHKLKTTCPQDFTLLMESDKDRVSNNDNEDLVINMNSNSNTKDSKFLDTIIKNLEGTVN